MADNKTQIKDENYYTIHGWMINRLGLKGIQLSLYAIIYGFSQDGENEYRGRTQYLCDFTGGTSKPTVLKALQELVDKGYLQKRDEVINGVRFVRYKAVRPPDGETGKEILPPVKKFNGGGKESLPTPGKEILPPTLHSNNNTDTPIERDKTPPAYEQVVTLYAMTCPSLPPVEIITVNRQIGASELLKMYSMEQIRRAFEMAEASSFLKGKNERGWCASFDWLISGDNMAKVLEGNFKDRQGNEPVSGYKSSFDVNEMYEANLRRTFGDDFDIRAITS